jgi:hypothetical protein
MGTTMKRDPGVNGENPLFFGFARGTTPAPLTMEPRCATLNGRPGAAEPIMHLTYRIAPDSGKPELLIEQHGWFHRQLDCNQRQAEWLRDFLVDTLPK